MEYGMNLTRLAELAYEVKVKQAMTRDVRSIGPDATMEDVRRMLKELKISGMPVCEDHELVGLISLEDLLRCLGRTKLGCRVEQWMTRDVDVLCEDEPLVHAIVRFESKGFGRFPVVTREGRCLTGILTKGDIVRCLLKQLERSVHEEEIQRYRASHFFSDLGSDRSALTLRYHLEGGNMETAGEKTSALKKSLKRLSLPLDVIRRTVIACYEAEMNVAIFARRGLMSAVVEEDRIEVHVADDGPGIPDVELAMTPGYSTAPDWIRELGFGAGMGLPNIRRCADEMNLDSRVGEGTDLRFVVYTRHEASKDR